MVEDSTLLSRVVQALAESLGDDVVDVSVLAARAGVREPVVCRVLESLPPGLLRLEDCKHVEVLDRLGLAILVVEKGLVAPERVARHLDWGLFEQYAYHAFSEAGYVVARRVYKPPPRGFEVDVVAVDATRSHGVAVDCKHWDPRRTPPSRIRRAAEQHVERVRRLARYWSLARNKPRVKPARLLPVLLVLRTSIAPVVGGVVVVPVAKLRGFIEAIPVILEDPRVEVISLDT